VWKLRQCHSLHLACQEFIVYIIQFHIVPLCRPHPPWPRDLSPVKWYTFARGLASLIHHRLTNNHGILANTVWLTKTK
jgi:hypothetical protein